MRQYVGIPFSEAPCWELCCRIYSEQYGITLPAKVQHVASPVEGCLVRVRRVAPLAEHWGVYTTGHVIHAQQPSSVMVPLRRFLEHYEAVEFYEVVE